MYTPIWNSKESKGVPSPTSNIPIASIDFIKRDFPKKIKKQKRGAAMPRYVIDGDWNGMISPGNIDLDSRPVVKMPNGEYATVRSASFTMPDGYEYLLPTITQDGRALWWAPDIINYYRKTGQYLGKFKDADSADAYAQALHESQEKQYADLWKKMSS